MLNKRTLSMVIFLALLLALSACAALKSDYEPLAKHPSAEDLGEQPKNCLECHDPRGDNVAFEKFVHDQDWGLNHRQQAYQNEAICAMCHQTSFCNDCHATGIELKPSLKNQSETYRPMQHRGDYLSRHRIDGRLDPTSCFRCHGNPKSAETCVRCHG